MVYVVCYFASSHYGFVLRVESNNKNSCAIEKFSSVSKTDTCMDTHTYSQNSQNQKANDVVLARSSGHNTHVQCIQYTKNVYDM